MKTVREILKESDPQEIADILLRLHLNEHIYHIAYTIPMICFLFCAYYGWKGYKVID